MLSLAFSALAGGANQLRNASAAAEGGAGILPARAQPHGYSLEDLAKITAAFNVTVDVMGNHPLPPPAEVNGSNGIQMLFTTATNTFNVGRNTFLYVPVLTPDDSPPVIGTFPNFADREAVLRYVFSSTQLGLQYSVITIDGQAFPLDERYVVAVRVPPLPDGGGTRYLASAAVIKPLKRGQHVVEISGSVTGDAVYPWCLIAFGQACPTGVQFSITYNVNVN
jgi:hypothetical protein